MTNAKQGYRLHQVTCNLHYRAYARACMVNRKVTVTTCNRNLPSLVARKIPLVGTTGVAAEAIEFKQIGAGKR